MDDVFQAFGAAAAPTAAARTRAHARARTHCHWVQQRILSRNRLLYNSCKPRLIPSLTLLIQFSNWRHAIKGNQYLVGGTKHRQVFVYFFTHGLYQSCLIFIIRHSTIRPHDTHRVIDETICIHI